MNNPWETPDPDIVKESLEVLTVRTGSFFDAFWHLTMDQDPAEVLKLRAKQKMYLARYGRQSYIQWSDIEVTELDAAMRALSEIMAEENGNTTVMDVMGRMREEYD